MMVEPATTVVFTSGWPRPPTIETHPADLRGHIPVLIESHVGQNDYKAGAFLFHLFDEAGAVFRQRLRGIP